MDTKAIGAMRKSIHRNNGLNKKQAEYLLDEIERLKGLLGIYVYDSTLALRAENSNTIDAIHLDILEEVQSDSTFS